MAPDTRDRPRDPSIALVTGATRGIGLETVRALASAGCVVLLGARDESRGRECVSRLRGEGLDVTCLPIDVTNSDGIATAAAKVHDRYGRLDILVNNAGVLLEADLTSDAPRLEDMFVNPTEVTMDILQKTFQTNTFGPIAVTNAMLPLLRQAGNARILNVSSSLASFDRAAAVASGPPGTSTALGDVPYPNVLAYNSSKAALNAATLQLVIALRGTGILVGCVDPGHCATDINGHTGERTAADAARVICQIALCPDALTGRFWDQDGELHW